MEGEQKKLLAEQELRVKVLTFYLKGSETWVKSCQQQEYEVRRVTLQKQEK